MRVGRGLGAVGLAMVLAAATVGQSTAGGPSEWELLEADIGSGIAVVGLERASDRALHAVWVDDGGSQGDDYSHVRISPNGVPGTVTDVFATPNGTLTWTPQLVRSGSGMRLVFTGDEVFETFATATAPTAGTPWTAPTELGTELIPPAYGVGADLRADGTLIVSGAFNSKLHWHQGVDAAIGNEEREIAGASMVTSNLAVDRVSDEAWIVWYDQTPGQLGVWAARVEPTLGAPVRGPRSVNGDGIALAPDQQLSAVSVDQGGIFTAYCVGYPTCTSYRVWEVGTARSITLPGTRNADYVALGPGRGGRVWAVWERDGHIFASRSNPGVTRFGRAIDLGAPPDSTFLYALSVDGVSARADVFLTATGPSPTFAIDIWHARALPTLTVRANPRRFDGDNETTVRFTVLDAGDPVGNAKVRVAGQLCRTDSSGTCSITFAPRGPGRPTVTASKNGFAPGTITLRIRQ